MKRLNFGQLQKLINSNPWLNKGSSAEMLAIRNRLAKEANARLKRLEKASSKVTGEGYDTYGAYQQYAAKVLKMDKPRFEIKKKEDNWNTIRKEISQIQRFLRAKSSTVTGMREIEAKRIATFMRVDGKKRKRAIKSAKNKEFYDFLNSGLLGNKLNPYFDSEKVVEWYEMAIENGKSSDEIIKIMNDAFNEYKEHTATDSIQDMERRLGIEWTDIDE